MTKRLPARLSIVALLLFVVSPALTQGISFLRFNNVPLAGNGVNSCSAVNPGSFSTGDCNGDGKLDLVVSSAFNTVLLLGIGDGTYKSIDLGFVAQYTLVADVNGDKKPDLLYSIGPIRWAI